MNQQDWQTNDIWKWKLSVTKSMMHITHFRVQMKLLFFSKRATVKQYNVAQKHVRSGWKEYELWDPSGYTYNMKAPLLYTFRVQRKTPKLRPKFLTVSAMVVCANTYDFVFRTQRSTYKQHSTQHICGTIRTANNTIALHLEQWILITHVTRLSHGYIWFWFCRTLINIHVVYKQ
jgi:hypothetical protein